MALLKGAETEIKLFSISASSAPTIWYIWLLLFDRSTNVGALSLRLVIVRVNSGDVAENSPSVAMTFKLYILSPFESDGFS